jgi:GNAT superfamily N-acetyltransferase
VQATEADIVRDLFGETPRAFCDIAEIDGKPVGFALWFYNYSTFVGRHGIYLEDLFVDPVARGFGRRQGAAGQSRQALRRRGPGPAGVGGARLERARRSASMTAWARPRWTGGRCAA